MNEQATDRSRWPSALSFAALTAIGLQALSGLGLAFHYLPTPELAHASLLSLTEDQPLGSLARDLHVVGATIAVLACMLTLAQALWRGAYKGEGRWLWLSATATLLAVIALGVTGELLPFSEQAVYATEVRIGLLGEAPLLGELIRESLLGGDAIAGPALLRFYLLHVLLLPLLLAALLFGWFRARKQLRAAGRQPWIGWPEVCAGLLCAALMAVLAVAVPSELGGAFVAGDEGFEAWPEWHFLWLNKLLKLFPAELAAVPGFWIPNALAALLLALPFVDRNPARSWRERPLAIGLAATLLLCLGGLGYANHLERPSNAATLPYSLDMDPLVRRGYALLRRHDCLECHAYGEYGEEQHDAPALDDMDGAMPASEYAEILRDPDGTLGTEDMPAYDYLDFEERRLIGLYLRYLNR